MGNTERVAGKSNVPQRIGVLCVGRREWVAGLVYTQNLISSLASLPEAEQPEVHLFAGPRFRGRDLKDLTGATATSCFTHRKSMSPWRQIAGMTLGLGKLKRPSSLERSVNALGLSA
jgi:hypothetical protein